MSAVERCCHTLEFLAVVRDTSVTDRVCGALDDLEAAYSNQEERTAALAQLLDQVCCGRRCQPQTPFRRFLVALIERRRAR